MTIPSTYTRGTTDSGSTPKVGGVAVGVTSKTDTSNGNPMTKVFEVKDNAIGGVSRKVRPVAATGGAVSNRKPLSGGTFAYEQVDNEVSARLVGTKLSGVASTAFTFPNTKHRVAVHKRQKQYGAKTVTAWSQGGWTAVGISGQRTNWDSSVAGVTSGVPDASSANFRGTTSGTPDDDAYGTLAVPSSFVFVSDGKTVKTSNYGSLT